MGEPTLTVGGMLAGILQFICMALILAPAIQLTTPAYFQTNFYGKTGIVNVTESTVKSNLQSQLGITTNSSFSNINTAALSGAFGGLAFMISGFSTFAKIMYNFPGLMFEIFTGNFSYLPFLPLSIVVVISFILVSYVSILLAIKLVGFIMKTVPESA